MYSFLRVVLIFSLVAFGGVAFAQEEAQEVEPVVITDVSTEAVAFEPIEISGVLTRAVPDGVVLTWETNRLAAGAATVVYRDMARGFPGKVVQQRLTSGELTRNHAYVIKGVPAGTYSVVIEAVGVDMQYGSFAGNISIPEESGDTMNIHHILSWFFSVTLLVMLVVLYEILRHRGDFKKAIATLHATKKKAAPKKRATRKRSTKKRATKK